MSGQPNLDPRLGAPVPTISTSSPLPPYDRALPPPTQQRHPQANSQNANSYGQQSPLQPYYQYPTPQGHSPQQTSVGGPSSASHSTQPSPAGPTPSAYPIPADRGDHSPDVDGNPQNGDDSKRPRACEACRGLKVRCDQDPAHPELPCRRCQKAGRQCIITAPSRKRQKKADGRVAELEKKLDQLTAVLQQQHGGYGQYGTPSQAPATDTMQSGASTSQHSLSHYSQPSPVSARPTSTDPSAMQPPQKRQRTDDAPRETESLDGAGVANTAPTDRYRSGDQVQAFTAKFNREMNESWAASADSMRNLIHRSPEEFMNRINQLVSPDIGVSIFNRYTTKLAPHMPAVVFPNGTTAEQVWKDKPILYVCILSATSAGILHPDIAKQLAREAIRAIADCVVCNGAKSLELIQAMQVLALWYKPPEKAEQTNFYQIIHMAAVMAIDIGLGKRFNAAKSRRGFGGPHAEYAPGPHLLLPQNSDTMEARRAWLCCYYLCASASMVLRRPNLLRWSHYMKESVDILESSPEACPSDKLFCQHIRVQHICEDIGLQFLMDDNTANISITDPKVSYALNVLENDLKTWVDNIPAELKNNRGLEFFKHVASLYLHEIALHFNHNVEDFRLPFTEESLKAVNNTSETLTQNQMAALESCRKAAHGILDTFLNFEVETVKTLPMLIFFVRCTYAMVILIKMHVAITTPGSEIGKIMTSDDVRVDHYIDSLMGLFSRVANEQEFRPHPKILRILSVLKEWFRKHKENVAAQARGEQLPHPPTTTQQGLSEATNADRSQAGQTPLHVLSQLATDDHLQQTGHEQTSRPPHDWTFNSPFVFNYGQRADYGKKAAGAANQDGGRPAGQQQAQQQPEPYAQVGMSDGAFGNSITDQYGLDPQMAPDYLWGSGFEQAMEINLGDMTGLSNNGMDGLFLGNGMGPFGFAGDAAAGGQW